MVSVTYKIVLMNEEIDYDQCGDVFFGKLIYNGNLSPSTSLSLVFI